MQSNTDRTEKQNGGGFLLTSDGPLEAFIQQVLLRRICSIGVVQYRMIKKSANSTQQLISNCLIKYRPGLFFTKLGVKTLMKKVDL